MFADVQYYMKSELMFEYEVWNINCNRNWNENKLCKLELNLRLGTAANM